MNGVRIAASAIVALALSTPVLAQGNSQAHKKNAPPSRSDLTSPSVVTVGGGATPFAWIDDASTLEPGSVWISASAMSWHGGGASELNVPIVDATIGLTERVHLSASVPTRLGAGGTIGTTYFSAKIGVFERKPLGLKVAVAPTLELLSRDVLEAVGPAESRAHWGAPVSAEISHGRLRAYTGVGYFSRGVWFSGAGASVQTHPKVFVSGTLSRSWRRDPSGLMPIAERSRMDVSGALAYVLRPQIVGFGSVGRTVGTLAANGAGTSVSGGVSILVAAGRR
jgi:hypothetical protein